MTYLECRQDGRRIWIGPFSKALDARVWLLRHETAHRLQGLALHEQRVKVLYAAYEHHDTTRCIGVFVTTAAALAAVGKNGVVMDWRREDCLTPDDPPPLQPPREDPRTKPHTSHRTLPERGEIQDNG